jgi:hypothetical protein
MFQNIVNCFLSIGGNNDQKKDQPERILFFEINLQSRFVLPLR